MNANQEAAFRIMIESFEIMKQSLQKNETNTREYNFRKQVFLNSLDYVESWNCLPRNCERCLTRDEEE